MSRRQTVKCKGGALGELIMLIPRSAARDFFCVPTGRVLDQWPGKERGRSGFRHERQFPFKFGRRDNECIGAHVARFVQIVQHKHASIGIVGNGFGFACHSVVEIFDQNNRIPSLGALSDQRGKFQTVAVIHAMHPNDQQGVSETSDEKQCRRHRPESDGGDRWRLNRFCRNRGLLPHQKTQRQNQSGQKHRSGHPRMMTEIIAHTGDAEDGHRERQPGGPWVLLIGSAILQRDVSAGCYERQQAHEIDGTDTHDRFAGGEVRAVARMSPGVASQKT